eukprot:g3776.t1
MLQELPSSFRLCLLHARLILLHTSTLLRKDRVIAYRAHGGKGGFWRRQAVTYVLLPFVALVLIGAGRRIPWVQANAPSGFLLDASRTELDERLRKTLLDVLTNPDVLVPDDATADRGQSARLQALQLDLQAQNAFSGWRQWVCMLLKMITLYVQERDDTLLMNFVLTLGFALGFRLFRRLQADNGGLSGGVGSGADSGFTAAASSGMCMKMYLLRILRARPTAYYLSVLLHCVECNFLFACTLPLLLWLGNYLPQVWTNYVDVAGELQYPGRMLSLLDAEILSLATGAGRNSAEQDQERSVIFSDAEVMQLSERRLTALQEFRARYAADEIAGAPNGVAGKFSSADYGYWFVFWSPERHAHWRNFAFFVEDTVPRLLLLFLAALLFVGQCALFFGAGFAFCFPRRAGPTRLLLATILAVSFAFIGFDGGLRSPAGASIPGVASGAELYPKAISESCAAALGEVVGGRLPAQPLPVRTIDSPRNLNALLFPNRNQLYGDDLREDDLYAAFLDRVQEERERRVSSVGDLAWSFVGRKIEYALSWLVEQEPVVGTEAAPGEEEILDSDDQKKRDELQSAGTFTGEQKRTHLRAQREFSRCERRERRRWLAWAAIEGSSEGAQFQLQNAVGQQVTRWQQGFFARMLLWPHSCFFQIVTQLAATEPPKELVLVNSVLRRAKRKEIDAVMAKTSSSFSLLVQAFSMKKKGGEDQATHHEQMEIQLPRFFNFFWADWAMVLGPQTYLNLQVLPQDGGIEGSGGLPSLRTLCKDIPAEVQLLLDEAGFTDLAGGGAAAAGSGCGPEPLTNNYAATAMHTQHADKLCAQLSGGWKRKFCCLVALSSGEPSLVILDEPTSGMDPQNRRSTWDLIVRRIRGENQEAPLAVILTTHHMEEAEDVFLAVAAAKASACRADAPGETSGDRLRSSSGSPPSHVEEKKPSFFASVPIWVEQFCCLFRRRARLLWAKRASVFGLFASSLLMVLFSTYTLWVVSRILTIPDTYGIGKLLEGSSATETTPRPPIGAAHHHDQGGLSHAADAWGAVVREEHLEKLFPDAHLTEKLLQMQQQGRANAAELEDARRTVGFLSAYFVLVTVGVFMLFAQGNLVQILCFRFVKLCLQTLTEDARSGLRELFFVNGCRPWVYWLANVCFDFLFLAVSVSLFFLLFHFVPVLFGWLMEEESPDLGRGSSAADPDNLEQEIVFNGERGSTSWRFSSPFLAFQVFYNFNLALHLGVTVGLWAFLAYLHFLHLVRDNFGGLALAPGWSKMKIRYFARSKASSHWTDTELDYVIKAVFFLHYVVFFLLVLVEIAGSFLHPAMAWFCHVFYAACSCVFPVFYILKIWISAVLWNVLTYKAEICSRVRRKANSSTHHQSQTQASPAPAPVLVYVLERRTLTLLDLFAGRVFPEVCFQRPLRILGHVNSPGMRARQDGFKIRALQKYFLGDRISLAELLDILMQSGGLDIGALDFFRYVFRCAALHSDKMHTEEVVITSRSMEGGATARRETVPAGAGAGFLETSAARIAGELRADPRSRAHGVLDGLAYLDVKTRPRLLVAKGGLLTFETNVLLTDLVSTLNQVTPTLLKLYTWIHLVLVDTLKCEGLLFDLAQNGVDLPLLRRTSGEHFVPWHFAAKSVQLRSSSLRWLLTIGDQLEFAAMHLTNCVHGEFTVWEIAFLFARLRYRDLLAAGKEPPAQQNGVDQDVEMQNHDAEAEPEASKAAHTSLHSEVLSKLRALDLYQYRDRQFRHLSGGNQRKVLLLVSLLFDPKLVLLDEPTAGVDPLGRQLVWRVLLQEQQQGARAGVHSHRQFVLTTHAMEEAEALCDQVAIQHRGRFCCIGSVAHLKRKIIVDIIIAND